jgi:photosystem II stability/assembly factor-like uncharacterized protein
VAKEGDMWKGRRRNRFLVLLAAALLSARGAVAGDGTWTRLGPETLNVISIAVDPFSASTLYAAGFVANAGARLAKSSDAGASWSFLESGCASTTFDFVATHPSAPGTVYAGAEGSGGCLRRSTDGGRTWAAFGPATGAILTTLVVDPTETTTLYAGGNEYGCDEPCLFKSRDAGRSWSALALPLPYQDVGAIAIDPLHPETVYVAAWHGTFRSEDGGTTWVAIEPASSSIYSIAIDPGDPGIVYAGGVGGIFRSDDGGASWSQVLVVLDGAGSVRSFAIDRRVSPATVYAAGARGVFRTFDRGTHWEALSTGIVDEVTSLAISSASPPVLYAGTRGGVYALTLERAPGTGGEQHSWIVPSSAHSPGRDGAFYTTDLAIANPGAADATFTIRFVRHDADGTDGPLATRTLAAGRAVTYMDVLGSLFGIESGYGALQIISDSAALRMTAFTSTPSADGRGRVGQGVRAFDATRLATPGSPAVLVGLRDDASARTNLVLANATALTVTVELALSGPDGAVLGTATQTLPPLGMTQVSSVVSALGGAAAGDGYLVVRVATAGGAVAAYASVVDNGTNDPRTILP